MTPSLPSRHPTQEPVAEAPTPDGAPPIDSRLLFGGLKVVHIDHCGQRYTLRITRENKLLLTK